MTKEQIAEANATRTAPRVTEEDLKANIISVEYVKHISEGGQILRWCILNTKSGFAVTGEPSAAVSAENDNPEQGEHYAYENAIKKLWPLMGYALKDSIRIRGLLTDAATQLTLCAEQFEYYAECHRLKDTAEADQKVKANVEFAGACRAAVERIG